MQKEFEVIDLKRLKESPTNPRHHFDEKKLDDLAASIRQKGIIEPLVVRPDKKGDRFEVVVGARRLRAARKAGLTEAPCMIRQLSDRDVVEVQLIENNQRADVHPLEESEGFARLLEFEGYTAELVAEKIGRDVSYIYKRLQLATLIDELKKIFFDGKITITHATMLCRLSADAQKESLDGLFETEWRKGQRVATDVAITPRQLNDWIHTHVLRSLATVAWDLADATLLPKAGACITCPKRSGANLALFGDLKKGDDRCTDRKCFEAKGEAQIKATESVWKAGQKKLVRVATGGYRMTGSLAKGVLAYHEFTVVEPNKLCDKMVDGLVVAGDRYFGQVIKVCLRSVQCKTHGHFSGGGSHRQTAVELWESKRRQLSNKIDAAVRDSLIDDLCLRVNSLSQVELHRVIIPVLFYNLQHQDRILELYDVDPDNPDADQKLFEKFRGFDAVDSARIAFRLALMENDTFQGEDDLLDTFAKFKGVKVEPIRKSIEKAVTAEFEKERSAALAREAARIMAAKSKEKKAKKKEVAK